MFWIAFAVAFAITLVVLGLFVACGGELPPNQWDRYEGDSFDKWKNGDLK